MKAKQKLFFVIILILFCFQWMVPQTGKGKARLAGVVIDEAGNPVASARVTIQFIQDQSIKHELTTSKKGEWAVLGLGSGRWRITAAAEGFIPTTTDTNVSQIELNPKVALILKKIMPTDTSVIQDEASLSYIDRAYQLFSEKNYDEALSVLQQFLAKNPSAYQAQILIADCYREKGEYDKAIEAYNLAIEEAKKDEKTGKEISAKAMAGIGDCYLRKQDFENAQKFFKQSIDAYPDNEALAYNVGEIYFANQKLDEAIQYFTLATKIKPSWSAAYHKLGLVYLNKADYEMAKQNLKKFLELEPDSEQAASVKSILDYLEKIKK